MALDLTVAATAPVLWIVGKALLYAKGIGR
jgi:hypothetical protein